MHTEHNKRKVSKGSIRYTSNKNTVFLFCGVITLDYARRVLHVTQDLLTLPVEEKKHNYSHVHLIFFFYIYILLIFQNGQKIIRFLTI